MIGSPIQKKSFCFQDGKAHRVEGCVGCTFDLDIYGRVACSKMAGRQRPNQPSVENNLLRLLKVEPLENDIVNNRSRNGFATILQIWDSFESYRDWAYFLHKFCRRGGFNSSLQSLD